MRAIIGTAGWAIPRQHISAFPLADTGTTLQRYATRLLGAEINSSFYRPHRRSTWERWGRSVPDGFQFSAKLPGRITHERKLVDCEDLVAAFLADATAMGPKLAILLVQLPPSLAFDREVAARFFAMLARCSGLPIACEPRHASWFTGEAETLLENLEVSRVAADPARVPSASDPGGARKLCYWRLHGSPTMYRSAYEENRLAAYARLLADDLNVGREVWCMFDNTAAGAALGDALTMADLLADGTLSASPL